MLANTRIQKSIIFLFVFGVFGITGCDKFSSVSDYFPSSEEEQPGSTAPTAVNEQISDELAPNVLARVGRWTITQEDYQRRLENLKEVAPDFDINDLESRQLVLEELIRQELLVQDAEQSGLAKQKDIVNAVDEFRRTLLVREVADNVTEAVDVSESEARDYYEQNKDVFIDAVEWKLREIVTFSEASAKEVLIELLKGENFAQMARIHSKSQTSSDGGDLGYLREPKFPQMANALATLEVGDVSNVFRGPEGYYIIKLEEKKGGRQLSFSELKEEIITNLRILKQQQAILEHINKLRQKTIVKVNEDLLKE